MATITQETRIELSGHESLTLAAARGYVVDCLDGELWITVDGDGTDVILASGRGFAIESDAPVVVSAFKHAAFRMRGQSAPGFGPSRIGGALAKFLRPGFPFPHPSIR